MTRRWTMVCLLLFLSLVPTTISVAELGTPALADDGNGNRNDKKDREEEAKEKKDKDDGKGNDAVEPAAPYRVEVSCASDEAAGQTVCTFTGVTPDGAKKVGHVDLPAADVCATVLGGDADYVDPDPNTGVVGYKSRGGGGVFSLVLAGEVAPGGTATYWVRAGNGVFPATGPGLVCGPASSSGAAVSAELNATGTFATPTTTAASATTPTGGTVAVHAYACAANVDPATIDWFGACRPGGSDVRFTLSPADPAQSAPIGDGVTKTNGEVRFEGLTPGPYELDAPDVVWCHAESDNVNARGELVVTPGTEVSVWIFLCDNAATPPSTTP